MSFLPYENYIIHSPLSVMAATQKISRNIISKSAFDGFASGFNRPQTQSMQYEGKVDGQTFKISRIIGYRNSFLPIITGKIETGPGGTEIHIKMRASVFVNIFTGIWLGATALASLLTIMLMINSRSFNVPYLLPIVMFIFGSLLFSFSFKFESRMSKAFLNELFELKLPGSEWSRLSQN